ncbi:hypothetical protein J6590_064277 [Homalodisca vitripennis]|nr:hypothetical protein J6590_064277 [Homalodisca vitripennis]
MPPTYQHPRSSHDQSVSLPHTPQRSPLSAIPCEDLLAGHMPPTYQHPRSSHDQSVSLPHTPQRSPLSGQ